MAMIAAETNDNNIKDVDDIFHFDFISLFVFVSNIFYVRSRQRLSIKLTRSHREKRIER